ncbi:Protein cbp3, mitochondrial [Lobosporangium transversale]|uniref:Ubiquinol-cytochrome C chaperone-domain-containing protein n=1 Tax=Lobosporangium transversale TaxID=64571 RepID=A0A1Y2GC15_9FUNG|nr:ubiquinol-cytochrome C chaperone-domain-containing protein [Lobosporangium transversale]KAF9911856.1 Protein cbp3, mitochondrial [Lobosporangium transversale]ORZ04837.1 ubiquinol-cytochrome C chaperone-domain-containing protein [Lobosporangium transversale]|eukprot:XP_021876774.1 ubiquinol-cytochrome C chaperone-domain-containing protein [Lobosporangium transversale]
MAFSSFIARSSLQTARSIARAPCSRPAQLYTARAFTTSWSHSKQATSPASTSVSTSSNDIKPASSETGGSNEEPKGLYANFLRGLAMVTGHYTVGQTAMRSTHNFYEICAAQLQQKRSLWIDTCGLPDNFQTWFSVTHLHVWLLMVRIRAEKNGKVFQQQLVNHFFHDIEDRMRYNHKISSGRIITTYMHDFLAQFHGGVLAYDEGMCKDDPIMAAALWRNLFTSHGNPAQIALLVDYIRHELQVLDNISSEDFLESRNLFGTQAPALRGVPGK